MDEIRHKKGKIYYSMGEVSEMFDVNQSLIRFWESKFDILKPHKNKKGNRLFTPKDVDNLKLIYHLVKEKGMTLAGAQKILKQNKEGAERDMEIAERLMSIRSMLVEIREELKMGGSDFSDDDYEYIPTKASERSTPSDTDTGSGEAKVNSEWIQVDSPSHNGMLSQANIDETEQEEENLYADAIDFGFTEEDTPSRNEVQDIFDIPTEGFSENKSFGSDYASEPVTVTDEQEDFGEEDIFVSGEEQEPEVDNELSWDDATEEVIPEQPILAHTEQPLFEVEPIIAKSEEELEEEATAAEVMATLAELEKEEKPKPIIIEQTLF